MPARHYITTTTFFHNNIIENNNEDSDDDIQNEQSDSKTCRFCQNIFLTLMNRRRHEKLLCLKNPKSFQNQKIIKTDAGKFKCPKCPQTRDKIKPYLFQHYDRIHMDLPVNCHQCQNVYSNKAAVNNHIRRGYCSGAIGRKSSSGICKFCFKIFQYKNSVSKHIKNHCTRARNLNSINENQIHKENSRRERTKKWINELKMQYQR